MAQAGGGGSSGELGDDEMDKKQRRLLLNRKAAQEVSELVKGGLVTGQRPWAVYVPTVA